MSEIKDITTLDWRDTALPDGFVPVDAIVLVKGYYETGEGMSRMVWAHKWTKALAEAPSERVGQLEIARRLSVAEAMSDYEMDDDE